MEQPDYIFIGNHFAVDYVNTRINIKGIRMELLHSIEDVMRWLEQAGKLPFIAGSIESVPPDRQQQMFGRILSLRNRLEQTLADIIKEKRIPSSVIDELNRELADYGGYYQLEAREEPLSLTRHYAVSQLPALFLEETAIFLEKVKPENVKKCENDACILYFYDTSRNQQRRWCSMENCGNRVKVNKHYHRKKMDRGSL